MKLAIISDIHEDAVNLRLALHKIEKLQCDHVYCLGDISGFSVPHYHYFNTRNASECLRLVRENCSLIVIGNHDYQAAGSLPDVSPDFHFPEEWFQLDYSERKSVSKGMVWLHEENELDPLYSKSDRDYLAGLPGTHVTDLNGARVLFTHYLYPNLSGMMKAFYHTGPEYDRHFEFMDQLAVQYSFGGHAHPKGLLVATEKNTSLKGFNRKYYLKEKASILVPSITGKKIGSGFCIFDTTGGWVKAVRV